MKNKIIAFLIILPVIGFSQSVNQLTLTECFDWAKAAFPLMKQKEIAETITAIQLEQLELQKKPSISWNAQMTFQSEAVSLDLPLPNFEAVNLPLLRGQTTLDANYTLYDGGMVAAQQRIYEADLKAQTQQIETEFEKVKPYITQAFLGIPLLRQQITILEQAIVSIQTKEKPLEIAIQNGVALPSNLQRLKVEVAKIENAILEIQGSIQVLVSVLESWTKQDLADDVVIVLPNTDAAAFSATGKHPELEWFDLQKQQILSKESLLTARQKPKVGAFAQVGVGYPNPLNFFDNNVSPFGVVGVKFSWHFFDWGQTDKERQLLAVSTQMMDIQKEMFENNLSIADKKYEAEILKIENLLEKDKALIDLYDALIKELETQVDNGVTTTTDYLNQINEQTQAKLQLQKHLVQLQQVKVDYLSHKGLL
jgi:outer membrane protein TolC